MEDERIVRACNEYIDAYLDEYRENKRLKLTDIAEGIGYNASYLSREYKRKAGIALMKIVRNKTMKRANSYMDEERNIIDVAERIDYSKNGFTRAYKAAMGVNPSCVKNKTKENK